MQRGDTLLTREPLPAHVRLEGRAYRLLRPLKIDTWAANYLLAREDDGSRHVLKVARLRWRRFQHLCLPLDLQTDHEAALYERLRGVRGVPALTGRPCRFAFLHAWVPGRPIERTLPVPPGFFDALAVLLADVHRRGVAYVDMEKEENVLLGDDGAPWLIDFQISVAAPGWLARRFQQEDLRHLAKHKVRLAPGQVTRAELGQVKRRSLPLRLHRLVTRPYFALRRQIQERERPWCPTCNDGMVRVPAGRWKCERCDSFSDRSPF